MTDDHRSKRSRQIADVIHKELAMYIKKSIRDPRLANFSITGVDLAPDLGLARIYFSVLDKSELSGAEAALEKIQGNLRSVLAKNIKLRYTPKIKFIYDQSVIEAEHLSRLINKLDIPD